MRFLGLSRIQGFSGLRAWFGTDLTVRKCLAFSFLAGFLIRLIPEVLAFPYPISWDMLNYAYFMRSGVIWQNWSSFFTSTWLLYVFLFPAHTQLGLDSFMLLKITGPLLFGFNVCGVYWFARSMFDWEQKKSLLAGAFFSLQLASLRISAEFLRNTLGLGLLLFTLPLIRKLDSRRGFFAFTVLSLLTVFAHEYAAVTLLVASLVLIALGLLHRKSVERIGVSKKLAVAVLPVLIVFSIGLFLRVFPVHYEPAVPVGPNVVWVNDTVNPSYRGLPFFVNYLGMDTGLDIYPSYLSLILNLSVLFAVLYLPFLYLVWKGFFRNDILDVWTGLLIFGSFGCLVTPFFALEYWHRWMFMLVYPFTFYAVNGAQILVRRRNLGPDPEQSRSVRKKVSIMVLAAVLLAATYLVMPSLMVNAGLGIHSPYANLVNTGKYFSIAPAVPYQDVDGTIKAVYWLKDNMGNDSCAVLQNAFVAWAKLYLGNSYNIVGYQYDANLAADLAVQKGYKHLYLLSFNENIDWYQISVPQGFVTVQNFSRIGIYEKDG